MFRFTIRDVLLIAMSIAVLLFVAYCLWHSRYDAWNWLTKSWAGLLGSEFGNVELATTN
jgi:hypothetical protein